jgi:xanthine dehydrogenase accessory factor
VITASGTATAALDALRAGRRVAEAVVVARSGSSPFAVGAAMIVDEDGTISGSVSGGCVDSAVVQEALGLLQSGASLELHTYGISDDLAGTAGLTCGGIIEVAVAELAGEAAISALRARADGRPAALAIVLDGELAGRRLAVDDFAVAGSLGGPGLLDTSVARDARGLVKGGTSTVRRYGHDGSPLGTDLRVFFSVQGLAPRMVLIGASDFAAALAPVASRLGYVVTICDGRAAFARSPRLTETANVVVDRPDRLIVSQQLGPRDAVLVLTHDPKFDEPALRVALASDAGYVGALGSRRTVADRRNRLLAADVDPADLDRLFSPCGLDLGARTPDETAISILAEIIAWSHRRDAGPLRDGDGPIHAR